jgi:hypothetical protein
MGEVWLRIEFEKELSKKEQDEFESVIDELEYFNNAEWAAWQNASEFELFYCDDNIDLNRNELVALHREQFEELKAKAKFVKALHLQVVGVVYSERILK